MTTKNSGETLGEILRCQKLAQIARELSDGHFGDKADYDKLNRLSRELRKLTGVCGICGGKGIDGDPGDAAGVGAGTWNCEGCGGSGFIVQEVRERLEQELKVAEENCLEDTEGLAF